MTQVGLTFKGQSQQRVLLFNAARLRRPVFLRSQSESPIPAEHIAFTVYIYATVWERSEWNSKIKQILWRHQLGHRREIKPLTTEAFGATEVHRETFKNLFLPGFLYRHELSPKLFFFLEGGGGVIICKTSPQPTWMWATLTQLQRQSISAAARCGSVWLHWRRECTSVQHGLTLHDQKCCWKSPKTGGNTALKPNYSANANLTRTHTRTVYNHRRLQCQR